MDSPAQAPPARHAAGVVAVVLKGYPRLSETFIAQELHALEQHGFALRLCSLRKPTDAATHPLHARIRASVDYLPEYLHDAPLRVLRAWRHARRLPGYRAALSAWRRDLRRDRTRNRARRFGQALVLAAELPREIVHLHAHFLHTPASVARYAALLRGIPWSVSAHAKDIWTLPAWEKREKLHECAFVATCTACNAEHLRTFAPSGRVELVYHGIDTSRFPAPTGVARGRDGRDPADPVRLLCVGRAVDKKGFDDLLDALATLPSDCHWRLVHIGDGPRLAALQDRAARLGVQQRVQWQGARAHDDVLAAYRDADLFVLPCRISDDGDRDGLPNVLLEAQSQRIACVSTRVSGIPELIANEESGLLVPPRDPRTLAGAISRLIADPGLRHALAEAGFARTTQAFSLTRGIAQLAARFDACLVR
ncbi:MAG TPA: glycosyltransferase family 4 protein [Casimicrobiaceae bacterium]|nr:glycosyltransferase family 4 protein [Casimicrobiaceae bacterium]